jgi:hypothetical protein
MRHKTMSATILASIVFFILASYTALGPAGDVTMAVVWLAIGIAIGSTGIAYGARR